MAEQPDVLFVSLVQQFQVSALIGLGKMENPITKQVETNLEQAKYSIDVLSVLEAKTAGNLTTEEDAMLKQATAQLKMAYVGETSKG